MGQNIENTKQVVKGVQKTGAGIIETGTSLRQLIPVMVAFWIFGLFADWIDLIDLTKVLFEWLLEKMMIFWEYASQWLNKEN